MAHFLLCVLEIPYYIHFITSMDILLGRRILKSKINVQKFYKSYIEEWTQTMKSIKVDIHGTLAIFLLL